MDKLQIVRDFLKGGLESRVKLSKELTKFRRCANHIFKNIDEMNNGKEPTVGENNNDIFDTVKFIKIRFLESPVDKTFSQFSESWIYLVYNWNENTIKSPSIKEECIYTQRLIEDFVSMKEVLDNLKFMNDRLKNFKSWTPPAFEISKHFIDYLE